MVTKKSTEGMSFYDSDKKQYVDYIPVAHTCAAAPSCPNAWNCINAGQYSKIPRDRKRKKQRV